jgi:hypothetical protein
MVTDRQSLLQAALSSGSEDEQQVQQLFNLKDFQDLIVKTEIPPGLIVPIAKALTIAELTNCDVLKKFIRYILLLQISKDRKGRIELMEAISAVRRMTADNEV